MPASPSECLRAVAVATRVRPAASGRIRRRRPLLRDIRLLDNPTHLSGYRRWSLSHRRVPPAPGNTHRSGHVVGIGRHSRIGPILVPPGARR